MATTLHAPRSTTFLYLYTFLPLLEFEVAKTESVMTAATTTARTMTATPLKKSRSPSRSIVASDVMDGSSEGTRIGICAMYVVVGVGRGIWNQGCSITTPLAFPLPGYYSDEQN